MDTFKVIYKNNNKYFKLDLVRNIDLKEIEFSQKNIDYNLSLGIRNFKCNINAPLEKLFKLVKIIDKNITIQFLDYCYKIKRNVFMLSDEKFSGKTIEFTSNEEHISNEVVDIQNNNLGYLANIAGLETIPIDGEDLVNLYIKKIESYELDENISNVINDIFSIFNRFSYENVFNAPNIKKLHRIVLSKIYEIYYKFNFDNIKNEDSISLMNEIIQIARLFHKDDTNSIQNFYDKKEFLLLDKINDLVCLDMKIKNLKINMNKYDDSKYDRSKNFYYSSITRTSWIDELEYNNITGLLVKIDPKEINKNAYNLDYVPIMDITHTIISFEQILEAYKIFHKNNGTLFDDNLGTTIISGFGIGNGNCMIPLYLNEDHWKLVEHYLDLNNGIIFNRNPLISKRRHNDIYYNIMTNMINFTFSDENYSSEKWVQLLFSMLRTVYEISKYDSFLVNKFKNNLQYRVDCNINKILILSLFDKDDNNVRYIIEEQVRRKMKSIYRDINVLDKIYNFNNIEECLSYEYNYITNKFDYEIDINTFNTYIEELEENNIFSTLITMVHGIISMRTIIKEQYIDIFNHMDSHGGVLQDDLLHSLKDCITDKLIKPTNYLLNSSINPKFSSHINFTKNKKFRMQTLKDNDILQNDLQLKSLIIQSIIQRVNKCRKKAIDNGKYLDPFKENVNIIRSTGVLISSRYIREFYNLSSNFKSYIDCINTLGSNLKYIVLLLLHIRKTISLKKNILDNIHLVINKETIKIIENVLNKKTLPNEFSHYSILFQN